MQPEGPAASDGAEPGFDVEGFAANYTSHAKVHRLLFVAGTSADASVQLEALRLAHDEMKKAGNVIKYREIMDRSAGRLGPVDQEWLDANDARIAAKQEKLEGDLATYKANLVKESIRMGHNDLGDFFYAAGDLQNAFKSYVRMRDYCATSKQIVAMCLAVIKTGFELDNYVHVQNYIQKAEQTPNIEDDKVSLAKLRAASALYFLRSKKYKLAAMKFTEVGAELGTMYNDVLAPGDVAVYGALCSLASFSRPEMKSRIINNIAFREFLELQPEVRETVHAFYGSSYAACLQRLEALKPQLLLDAHLAAHVEALYSQVRSKALIQYVTPFTSVNLATMATAFATTVGELQKELEALIVTDRVKARIDAHSGVLYARRADTRTSTFHAALRAGEEYLRNTKSILLRANLQRHDFTQRPTTGRGPRGGAVAA